MALGSHQGGGGVNSASAVPHCAGGGEVEVGGRFEQLPFADGPKLLRRRLTPRAVSRRAIILLPHTALLGELAVIQELVNQCSVMC